MHILMFTNTFTPHVGGVARSVQQFSAEYRKLGHRVLVVAPEFAGLPDQELDVVRMPAVQRFNGSDFSVPVSVPGMLTAAIDEFHPGIVHAHHPFLLGDTALRVSAARDLPIVFTHHTQYERYTHYVPGDSLAMKQFVIDLAVGYCNLCDAVIAPSATIRQRLLRQGVSSHVVEIPTGVDTQLFGQGDGQAARAFYGLQPQDFVLGHVGRLAPEKGLEFLCRAVVRFMVSDPDSRFLVAGGGPSESGMRAAFRSAGIADRLILAGTLEQRRLADLYAAMDLFVFASQSETQGMVLTEAMAAGTPVVAVDAPGVREVVCDGVNGRMLAREDATSFVRALQEFKEMSAPQHLRWRAAARQRADEFSMPRTARQAIALYAQRMAQGRRGVHGTDVWSTARRLLESEWKIWRNVAGAASHAILGN